MSRLSSLGKALRRELRDLRGLCLTCGRGPQIWHPKMGKTKLCNRCSMRAVSLMMYGDEKKLERDLPRRGKR